MFSPVPPTIRRLLDAGVAVAFTVPPDNLLAVTAVVVVPLDVSVNAFKKVEFIKYP